MGFFFAMLAGFWVPCLGMLDLVCLGFVDQGWS